jgi:hypothetical protein
LFAFGGSIVDILTISNTKSNNIILTSPSVVFPGAIVDDAGVGGSVLIFYRCNKTKLRQDRPVINNFIVDIPVRVLSPVNRDG